MLARLGEHLLQVGDAREDRRDGDEAHADRVGEQPRDRRLAGAGRPPQDHRGELARRHHPPDRAVRPGQMLLADHLVELLRPQPVGERRVLARRRRAPAAAGRSGTDRPRRPTSSFRALAPRAAAAPIAIVASGAILRPRRRPGGRGPAARATGGRPAARADDGEVDRLGARRRRCRAGAVAGAADAAEEIAVVRPRRGRSAARSRRRRRPQPRLGRRDQGDALRAVGGEPEPQPARRPRPAAAPTIVDGRRGDRRRRAPARPSGGGSYRAFRPAPRPRHRAPARRHC